MHIFKRKRDDSAVYRELLSLKTTQEEILKRQEEILSLLKAMPDPREELLHLVDQRIRQLKAQRKTD